MSDLTHLLGTSAFGREKGEYGKLFSKALYLEWCWYYVALGRRGMPEEMFQGH